MMAALRFLAPWIAVVVLGGCSDEKPVASGAAAQPTPVTVAETVEWPYPAFSQLAGVVSPGKRAVLSTRIAGTLTSVEASAGDEVKTGDLVATVDSREAQAAVDAARDRVAAAQAAAQQAERNNRRLTDLYEEDLIARVRAEEAQVQLSTRQAQLEAARAELKVQQTNLSYTRLTAPFDGRVTDILVDPGTFVGPGQPLAVIEERSQLQIDVPVSSELAASLTPGQQLSVLAGPSETQARARLVSVIPALGDENTGQRLRLSLDSPPAGLAPGQVVTVQIPADPRQPRPPGAWVGLPAAALIERGQLTGVLLVDDSGKAPRVQLRWIKTAAAQAATHVTEFDLIPVTQGLTVGERVVLNPSADLRDGQAVSVTHTASSPEEQ